MKYLLIFGFFIGALNAGSCGSKMKLPLLVSEKDLEESRRSLTRLEELTSHYHVPQKDEDLHPIFSHAQQCANARIYKEAEDHFGQFMSIINSETSDWVYEVNFQGINITAYCDQLLPRYSKNPFVPQMREALAQHNIESVNFFEGFDYAE